MFLPGVVPPSFSHYRVALVHRETCPYCRSIYAPFMEAVSRLRASGIEVEVLQVHQEKNRPLADSLTPTVPALFKVDKSGNVVAKHEGRRNAESIASFVLHGPSPSPIFSGPSL